MSIKTKVIIVGPDGNDKLLVCDCGCEWFTDWKTTYQDFTHALCWRCARNTGYTIQGIPVKQAQRGRLNEYDQAILDAVQKGLNDIKTKQKIKPGDVWEERIKRLMGD